MINFEELIKEYSTKKLKSILETQSNSYHEDHIDYIKDELIRRGENITFDVELEKELSEMNDEDLKALVEINWNDYHLEYIELSRAEYIRRGFINKTSSEEQDQDDSESKYPALNTIIGINSVAAWIYGISAIGLGIYFIRGDNIFFGMSSLGIGALLVLFTIATSESIKVIIDIEENTRKAKD
jgi:hypothetical protein